MSVPVDESFFSDVAGTLFPSARGLRGVSYFFVTFILASINTYGVPHPFLLAVAMGILAFTTRGARIALLVIALLAIMAALPISVIETVRAAAY